MSLHKESAEESAGADKSCNIEQGNMLKYFNSNVDVLSLFLFDKYLHNNGSKLSCK